MTDPWRDINLADGKLTLSFFKTNYKGELTQLRSSAKVYATVDGAWIAALEAFARYPEISYAEINFTPTSGSIRAVQRVERG